MRRRLTLLVAATTVLVLMAFVVPAALLVREVAEDRALSRATDVIQALVPLVGVSDPGQLRNAVDGGNFPVTVYLPGGGAPIGEQVAPTPAVRLSQLTRQPLTVDTAAGIEIVVPVTGTNGTSVVRAVVPDAELTRGVPRAWLVLAALGLALVLVGLLVADRLARTLIAPIADLSQVSHRLARAELTARADPAGPPEIREVAGALNHLAGRIQDLLSEEREQVADLSHRLRTPLTALRLEAEALHDPDESARVTAAADDIERAVTAVIQQARRRGTERPAATCDATAVVTARVAFWAVLADDTDREVHRDLPQVPLPVAVPADDLAAALDAVLGNVFAHTPDGTAFTVSLTPRPGGGAVLTVADEGPGFPASHTGVLQRGASGGGSTGLGLDIARRAAEESGGSLSLDAAPSGGALVRLELAV
ncbi:HAMP domain-containing sensor histidine kinase [Actinoplanes sp. NPDC051470]|uniref:sensor histidine kinase n=1 Tax=Actinoplanes sp. NPDC051470 TaxID=3157224 RepID=UPI003432CD64